jgi:hypothetical protein
LRIIYSLFNKMGEPGIRGKPGKPPLPGRGQVEIDFQA